MLLDVGRMLEKFSAQTAAEFPLFRVHGLVAPQFVPGNEALRTLVADVRPRGFVLPSHVVLENVSVAELPVANAAHKPRPFAVRPQQMRP